MIADLIGKLVIAIEEMIKAKKEYNRQLFENFIDPIYVTFDEINNEYLTSFAKYKELILNDKCSLTEDSYLFSIIKNDSLFSKRLRIKMNGAFRRSYDDDLLTGFIYSIANYLSVANDDFECNTIRLNLEEELKEIFALDLNSNKYRCRYIMSNLKIPYDSKLNETEIDQICKKYKIDLADSHKIKKIKKYLALDSIDLLVNDINKSYSLVNDEYNYLKTNLLK
jgi:hypothetical protein